MRDALLLLVVLGSVPLIIRHPFTGVIAWAWFTLMTPHQLAYGVFGVPLNMVIAAVTFGAYLVTGKFPKFRADAITILACLFIFWLIISQIFSLDRENSAIYFERFVKTMIFAVVCMQMADTKLKVNALVWMLVGGIGFFALKGGLFTLFTLGQFRVYGLENTTLEDNNHIGIAIVTILPLILYIRDMAERPIIRNGALALFAIAIIAILGTHSRGAFVGLVVFAGFFWLKSQHKIAIAVVGVLMMAPAIAFMPSKWTERMTSITEATEDSSFMARVEAWTINTNLALENPITGAGLRNSYQPEIARQVVSAKLAEEARAGHSIYFEVLGGAGFVGLFLYMSMLAAGFFKAYALSRESARNKAPRWIKKLAYYSTISLGVFGVAGASVSMEMWDGYLMIVALVSVISHMATTKAPTVVNRFEADRLTRWRGQRPRRRTSTTPKQSESPSR